MRAGFLPTPRDLYAEPVKLQIDGFTKKVLSEHILASMRRASTGLALATVYVAILWIGLIGLVLELIARTLERKLVHWSGKE